MAEDAVTELKIMVGRIEERLKVLERVIYGMAGTILVGVVGALLSTVLRNPT